jgi:hypothetical protein
MNDDATPVAIEEEATTPVPRQTMAELVFDCAALLPCKECGDEYTALELSEDCLCLPCVNRHLVGTFVEGPVSYAEDR